MGTKDRSFLKNSVRQSKVSVAPVKEPGVDVGFMGSREELADSRTIASRSRLRDQVDNDIESFLSHGGKISKIEPRVTAAPPERPINHYGRRPI